MRLPSSSRILTTISAAVLTPICALALVALVPAPRAAAQATAGNPPFTPFKDTSLLKPPAGHPVAILEFEDLECPACRLAFPIVHTAVDHYKIPLLRHDYLIPGHAWSKNAAITARYLEDKVSPGEAEQYRRDVFASQTSIAGPDDLESFTRRWFATHKLQMPFVMDPSGRFAAEVQADCTLGDRIGLIHTPTIVVLGPKGWIEVTDTSQLYTSIDKALAQAPAPPAVHNGVRRPSNPDQK